MCLVFSAGGMDELRHTCRTCHEIMSGHLFMDGAPVCQLWGVLVFSLVSTSPCGSGERVELDFCAGSALELSAHHGRLNKYFP